MNRFIGNIVRSLHIRGLRRRWLVNAVVPILLLVLLAVALYTVGSAQYYYNSSSSSSRIGRAHV